MRSLGVVVVHPARQDRAGLLAYGIDSTALLIELVAQGRAPDLVLAFRRHVAIVVGEMMGAQHHERPCSVASAAAGIIDARVRVSAGLNVIRLHV